MEDRRIQAQKRAAAEAAVAEVGPGMLIGLGTGTTAAFAIDALASRVRDGLECRAVATSERTERHAVSAGISMVPLDNIAQIDLAIDGVDEIDAAFRAVKGAGGAMLREKVVATAARRMIAIADASKAVDRLGGRPVPVEVPSFSLGFVRSRIVRLRGKPILRERDGKPVRTDQNNLILDCHFGDLSDPASCAHELSQIPGIIGHGLFLDEIDVLYLGTVDGVVRSIRPSVVGDGAA